MAKELRCADVIDGCDEVMRGETEDEVMAQGARHAREEHDIQEMDEETKRTVRSKIRDV